MQLHSVATIMYKQTLSYLVILLAVAVMHAVAAGDMRTVTRPTIPQTCTSLTATSQDDTQAIQKALDSCEKGKAVALSSGTFYSGPLNVPSGVSLLVDRNVTLKAIPDPKLYDLGANTCGTITKTGGGGCKPFIMFQGTKGSGVYGKGTIDGQGGATLTGKTVSWWTLIRTAIYRGQEANNPDLIRFNNSIDVTVHQIVVTNSPYFHIDVRLTNGFTAWGMRVDSPHVTKKSVGIHVTGSQNVTIAHCIITTKDDNIVISGHIAPLQHVSVYNSFLKGGNGLNVGSGANYGISDVVFSNITINNLRYGIHIRSNTLNGGPVHDITYDNICMQRVRWPICLDMHYKNLTGDLTPQFHDININNLWVANSGSYIFHAITDSGPIKINLNNVHIAESSPWSAVNVLVTGNWVADVKSLRCRYTDSEKDI